MTAGAIKLWADFYKELAVAVSFFLGVIAPLTALIIGLATWGIARWRISSAGVHEPKRPVPL